MFRPYTICIQWEGDWYVHRAVNRREALAWTAAYPATARVIALRMFARSPIFTRGCRNA